MSTDPVLLTTAEAAEYLSIPARTLKGWRLAGCGPVCAQRGHKRVRYTRAALEAFKAGVPGAGERPTRGRPRKKMAA